MLDKLLKSGEKDIQMIVFKLGTEDYAVPITDVQEIIMRQSPTRIPRSPEFVEGVINLRGHIIPVIDGKKKFSLEIDTNINIDESRIMILELKEETVGLIVDSVSEVVHLQVSNIEPPPMDMGVDTDFLWGVGKHLDKLLILLNPQKLLTVTETQNLKGISSLTDSIKMMEKESELSK